jgi:molybdenum cofactor cytidylyltransferase
VDEQLPQEPGGGWAAVILSAGESRRFGGQPKALLPVGAEPAIGRIARLCQEAGIARIVAVVGPHRDEIARSVPAGTIEFVENPDWAAGRTGSFQVGANAVPDAEEILLWPVDHPFVAEGTIGRLRAAADRDALAVWFLPTYRGEGGHPILLRRPAIARALGLAPSAPLRSLLPELGPQVRRVVTEDPGVLENVDSPDAYWSARAAWNAREGGSPWTES